MRHNIPLSQHNKNILITRYGVSAEQLTQDYWVKYIMSNPEVFFAVLNSRWGASDPQTRILRRANRLIKKHIHQVVGLPKPSGKPKQQKKFLEILKKSGLTQKNDIMANRDHAKTNRVKVGDQ